METDGKDDEPVTSPISTMDDGVGESSYNKTIDEGPGSTCDDSANDGARWINVESTVDGAGSDSDWHWVAIDSATDIPDRALDLEDGRGREPDATCIWDPQGTWAPALESTRWPLGSSLHTSSAGRREAVAGYELLSELGSGGMGIVYKARHLHLKRLVALKVIRHDRHHIPEDLARLEIEGEAVARLNHPNIVRIYEIGNANGVPFVALELLEGGTLKDRLASTPQPVREAAALVSTLARAVHAAHVAGILHRDIKPSNVLFDREGVPKVADFGLAKRLDVEDGQTITGQVIGTPSYMAPEQAEGWNPEIGREADIYSLGAVLYEMLTGRPPIKGTTQAETLKLVLEEDPVSPSRLRPKLPFDLVTICLKCIARDPRKRYPDAEGLALDLNRFLSGEPIRARRTPLWERAIKLSQRHRVITVVLAMGVLAIGVGSGAVLHAQKLKNQRNHRLVQTAEQEIFDAQGALAQKHWGDVRTIVSTLMGRIENESDDRLTYLRQKGKSLDEQARRGLAEETATEHARAQIREFRDDRDEARFLDIRFGGLTAANSVEATCQFARAGLKVFGVGQAGDQWALGPLPSQLSADERDEVADGFYELLLILADAVSQSPGTMPARRAEQAIRIINRARAVRSRATRAYHLRRSDYLDMMGDRGGAARERDAALQLPPADAFDFFLIGRELARKSEWKAAITHLETVTQEQPDHFWANCLLAICHLQIKEPSKARLGLNACLQQQPGRIWLYLLRGIANAAEGKLARDLAQLSAEPAALMALASEQFDAAETDYRKALALLDHAPADANLHYVLLVNRGHIRIERQDLTAAAADLQEAIRLNDHRFEAHSGLAHVYQRQGKTDDALAQLATAIGLRPDLAPLHRARADLLLGLGNSFPDLRNVDLRELEDDIRNLSPDRRDLAHRDLEVAVRCESPGKPMIAFDKTKQAVLYHVAGQYALALEACDAALKIVPRLAFTHQLRINVLLDLERYDDLLQSCDVALRSVAPSAELYELRGMAKDDLDDYSGAIADYTLSLSLRGENPRVLRRRGWSYLADDANRPAVHDFDEAIRLAPSNADAYGGRGLAKARLGGHEDAVRDASKSLELDKKSWRITYNAARVYAQAAVAVDAESRKTGPVAVRVVTRYLERSVDLVRLALERAPADERSMLFRETMLTDPALLPIRRRLRSLESLKFDPQSPAQPRSAPR